MVKLQTLKQSYLKQLNLKRQRLVRLRRRERLRVEDIAIDAGVSENTVWNFEQGKSNNAFLIYVYERLLTE